MKDIINDIRDRLEALSGLCAIASKDSFYYETGRMLAGIFGIDDTLVFGKKFLQAVSGTGKELTNIISGKASSARRHLLYFYGDRTCLQLDGDSFVSDATCFEFANPANDTENHPSNVDVVLYDNTRIVFLECKHLEPDSCAPMGNSYFAPGLRANPNSTKNETWFGLSQYVVGELGITKDTQVNDKIKQMITHYIGVARRILETPSAGLNEYCREDQAFINGRIDRIKSLRIYLGAVISGVQARKPVYTADYPALARQLNGITDKLVRELGEKPAADSLAAYAGGYLEPLYKIYGTDEDTRRQHLRVLSGLRVLPRPILYKEVEEWNHTGETIVSLCESEEKG
ncbi:MAG: hypothetical protein IJT95_05745 [Abditibacteriota bacterium]|nr:hypothetical protein [Abditibacteriota bacterium]